MTLVVKLPPICPNNLQTMKSNVVLPPGVFMHFDVCSHRNWRRVQRIASKFWCRWRKIFFSLLRRAEENRTILKETSRLGMLFHEEQQHIYID